MARIGVQVEVSEESTKQTDYSNLPNGIYKLEITASAVPESGEGTPDHKLAVNTTIDVIEPEELKGRKLFSNYNLINPSIGKDGKRTAEIIGNKQYSCLLRALGKSESPEDSDDLHFHAFYAKIGLGKDSVGKDGKKYEARAEIKQYFYPTDDQGNALPEPIPAIDPVQPAAQPVARAQAPANDNRAAAAAKPAGSKPWGAAKKYPA